MHGMFAELLFETIFGALSTMPEPDPEVQEEQETEQGDEIVPLEFDSEVQEAAQEMDGEDAE